jgi:gliding motility-associated-like protein
MKSFLTLIGITCLFSAHSQQLAVNNVGLNSNPLFLLTNRMIGGGMNVFNVTFSGNASQQIGYYTSGTNAIGSASGVALSTGNVLNTALPNVSTSVGGNLGAINPTDADIVTLANGQTAKDWFILEFDFIPEGDILSMQYIFGSEEYGEYVCSNQADVFAILLSGTGMSGPYTNGAQNIAIVPSTSDPAGINSINDGVVGPFGTVGGCTNGTPSPYYNANTDTLMEFDGTTDVMSISQPVTCQDIYHMRIIIFDVGSKDFDSGLFFPEKGIYTNGSGTYDNFILFDSIIVEGCKPYEYVIYNVAGFNGQTVNLNISGTAQNGVDYQTISPTAVLPAGSNYFVITITPVVDGVTEGMETVIISFDLINPCGDTITHDFTIYIDDENPISATFFPNDQAVCAGNATTLLVNATGGFPPYSIYWNTIPGNNISVVPATTTTYFCEVYDAAGCTYYNNFTVTVNPVPVVDAGPDISICSGQPQTLGVFIDGGPGATYTWFPTSQLNSGFVPYPVMTPSFSQSYTVTVVGTGGCTATDNLNVTVLPVPTVNAGPDQTIVYLQTSATLSGTGSGTPQWSPYYYLTCDNCYLPSANPTETTNYILTVTAPNGCAVTDEVTVFVEVPTDIFVPSAFSPNGDGNNDELFVRGYTIASLKFKVFDRWGNLMFETTDKNRGWDGTANGVKASMGLYTYTLDAVFVNEAGSVSTAGEINLVR